MWLTVLLQFASVALLRIGLGKMWLRRPVTLLVLASAVYDGVSQALLSFPSVAAWDPFREGIQQGYIDEAALIMSAGMLAFTIAYLLTGTARRDAPLRGDDAAIAARMLDWRLLALACAPLAVLTYRGRGFNSSVTTGGATPLTASLAAEFFALLVVLAAFGFVLRHGPQWFLPTLMVQSVLLAATGERGPVIADAIVLVLLLARVGRGPSGTQLTTAVLLTATAVVAIVGVRTQQGRVAFSADSGLGSRVTALAGSLPGLGGTPAPAAEAGGPGTVAQDASRLDGVAFTGAILQGESLGNSRLDAAGIPESLLIAVPSAVWPSKLAHAAALDPVQVETDGFGLQQINFLPGFAGLYAGFLPAPWLIVFLTALGAGWGWGERLLLRARTPARLVLLAGAIAAALRFEQGLPGMLVTLRTAAVIAVIAVLTARMRNIFRAHAFIEESPGMR